VAAAAKGNLFLLVFGLLISIPLIAWSSQLVLKLIDRFPFTIYAGAALLGYVAGEMLVSEASLRPLIETQHALHWLIPAGCAILVVVIGKWFAVRKTTKVDIIDLVDESVSAAPDRAGEK